jgi:hypothetical protein
MSVQSPDRLSTPLAPCPALTTGLEGHSANSGSQMKMKLVCWTVMLVAALGLTGVARAADAIGPETFYGRYQGTAIAHDPRTMAFGFDKRDFDVEIGAAGNGGFFVAWTTVMRATTGKEIKRNNARIVFEPSGRPGIYLQQASAPDRASGLGWASISSRALSVRVLAILDDGTYEVQTYERTLAKDGLQLRFTSDRNGTVAKLASAFSQKAH